MAVPGAPSHWRTFLTEFRETFHTTGSIAPSSRRLARAMTLGLEALPPEATILEAGPGTGAFTDSLIALLPPDARLILVELNPRFADVLRRRLDTEPSWRAKPDQVELRVGSALDLPPGEVYDAIVCGLPFANFDPDLVERLLRLFLDRLKASGTLRFFEYWGIRRLKSLVSPRAERARLAAITRIVEGIEAERAWEHRVVLGNLPPALVRQWDRSIR